MQVLMAKLSFRPLDPGRNSFNYHRLIKKVPCPIVGFILNRIKMKKIDEDVVILNGGTHNNHETYQLYLLAKTIKTKRNLEKTFFVILKI